MPIKKITGINIQHPISELIVEGKKTIETRTYAIPPHLLNKEIALIETPGKTGKFKARIIAVIKFTKCYQFKTKKEFYSKSREHCVEKGSPWEWVDGEKWGWDVEVVKRLKSPQAISKRKGIKFTKDVEVRF
ncbi:MAG: ASCH domain-containing protein [Halobacteriovoraceae bacterium]|nr:ASCH domain-containing protein [Halobacteriovoraceae bacterium]